LKDGFILIAALVLLFPSRLCAKITGPPHHFSGVGFVTDNGKIWQICHTPHNARANEAPLWWGRLEA